jgi:uncharacterized spore protein YtfJ
MTDTRISEALSKLDAVKDTMSVQRVFGDAYQVDGTTIIPVALVRGGGGGGGGTDGTEAAGTGTGVGFAVNSRPVGAYVVKDGEVTWVPAIDVMRVIIGGQLIALAAVLVVGRALLRRKRRFL